MTAILSLIWVLAVQMGAVGTDVPLRYGVVQTPQGRESEAQIPQVRELADYLETARKYSPLVRDYRNRIEIGEAEVQRLKAIYRRSKLEVTGDLLFVPTVSLDGGGAAFRWNAQDGVDYYGYDLGESSGHLHAGLTWTQPLLGGGNYKVAREQALIQNNIHQNNLQMEEHQLERTVTEHYILCLLDKSQLEFADSTARLLRYQAEIVSRLVMAGLAKESDLQLLKVEQDANDELRVAAEQAYLSHLEDLNILCGILSTEAVDLQPVSLAISPQSRGTSKFLEQYRLDSLNVASNLRSLNLQYRPTLNLFVNGGLQTDNYARMYRDFGWSAGLTFSWTIYDGKQKRIREHQAQVEINTVNAYRDDARLRTLLRREQCLNEIVSFEERAESVRTRLEGYDLVLECYKREIEVGQRSVIDYVTVLRAKLAAELDYMTLLANRELAVAAYNYWNW